MNSPFLHLRGLTFTYRGASVPAIEDVDLDLHRAELVVLMGASGAGKSTLAKCLNRSVPGYQPGALEGEIWIDGRDVTSAGVDDLVGVVGLVTQDFEAQLFSTNVVQEVVFGLEQMGVRPDEMRERLSEALCFVGLQGFESRDPATLSGGEKQRLSIAAVLAMRPQLIIFDEPTTDLDPQGKREIFDVLSLLRNRGLTVLLIEHETVAAVAADRLIILAGGRIAVDGKPSRVLPQVKRLVDLGVRPADLDRIGAALGHVQRFASVEEAARFVRPLACEAADEQGPDRRDSKPVVALEDVHFSYTEGEEVLRGVSLRILPGQLAALIGPNGSGKTTMSKHLNGLLQPRSGHARWGDRDLSDTSLDQVAADVAYVFQNPDQQIFASSVSEEVRFALQNRGLPEDQIEPKVARALAAVGMQGFASEDPFVLGKGLRQRLAVASLLVLEPRLLILDEPTTGLDHAEQRQMMELLRRLVDGGMAVLIITHTPWIVAEYAERCIAMEAGVVIYDGPTRSFLADSRLPGRCEFALPDVTRLGIRLGRASLSVEEFLGDFGVG
jgi:energy-coupling factor transporter ATP-binding protein EcfA2